MFAAIPFRFEEPFWLILLLLIIPTYLMSRRSIGGLSRRKAYLTFSLRAIVLALLAFSLAHPIWVKQGEGVTVTVILDRSLSIPQQIRRDAVEMLRAAGDLKERSEDRLAVITVAKDASIVSLPDSYTRVTPGSDDGDLTATNLAEAITLALAVAPKDTANRIVLASDGNETEGSVRAAARIAAANNVPIDILTLEYEHTNEVIFERIIAPARARQGQTAEIKLVLHSQGVASGSIIMSVNGSPIDLNGDEPGQGVHVDLDPGVNVLSQIMSLDRSGPHEFEAVFIPDEPADINAPRIDGIDRNNVAMAVSFVGGQGKVLVIDDSIAASEYLVYALRESGIETDVVAPDALFGGIVFLSGYDAVVLVNVGRFAFDDATDRMLHAYVHDLGGGLVMVGGDQSFGAGGWIDSEVAKTLPVELNPPQTRQMPAGALALIMHSCEMPQGNFWGQKVAESAIEALSRLDYVGIIEDGGMQGCIWAHPMGKVGDKRAALQATKTLTMGDMMAFAPSMKLALNGLTGTSAAQRHAIIISDGDPQPPSNQLLQSFVDNRITVTTVMVGGHGTQSDLGRMRNVATTTGGTFYNVRNPKNLPQIFIKEAQLVSRSLIQDGQRFIPSYTRGVTGPVHGFAPVPAIDGYILTAPRAGLAQNPIFIRTNDTTTGETNDDPLFAYWNYGLGRSIAYTSDLSNLWGAQWVQWERFKSFWEQAIRWAMRPSSPANMHLTTRTEGDETIVEVEALEADASFLNFLRTSAVVLKPDASTEALALQQTGPGRYKGSFKTDDAGAYLVNVAFNSGEEGGRGAGNLQTAVTVPYAKEFRSYQHDKALMSDLAEMTGGRELMFGDPALVDLFNRNELNVPRSPVDAWDIIAIIAASLLLLDVAARRISVDPARVAAMVGRAASKRQDVSTDTVAAWKRTRTQLSGRMKGQRSEPELRKVKFEAAEEDEGIALDVGAESVDDPLKRKGARQRTDDETKPDAGEDEGDYTSRLLAAKRRARRTDDAEGDDAS
jgi:uncharacterized membrane protein